MCNNRLVEMLVQSPPFQSHIRSREHGTSFLSIQSLAIRSCRGWALVPYSIGNEGRFLQNTWMVIGARSTLVGRDSREILILGADEAVSSSRRGAIVRSRSLGFGCGDGRTSHRSTRRRFVTFPHGSFSWHVVGSVRKGSSIPSTGPGIRTPLSPCHRQRSPFDFERGPARGLDRRDRTRRDPASPGEGGDREGGRFPRKGGHWNARFRDRWIS